MTRNYLIIGIILIVGVLAYSLISRQSNLASLINPNSQNISPTEQVNTKEFTITSANFSFTPNQIIVNQNDRVKITLKNTESAHDFRLDEFNAAIPVVQGGQEASVTFIADKKGTFEYYCSVDGHREMGMVGKFIVN